MFDRVTAALTAADLLEKYRFSFVENEVSDKVVGSCLQNRGDLFLFLSEVIPVVGHRMLFISEFRKTGTTQEQNQQQHLRWSAPSEITILHEKASANSATTASATTRVKIEPISPSSTSTCSSFFPQRPATPDFITTPPTLIQSASAESLKFYKSKMTELLSTPGFFLDESVLLEKHIENRSKAIDSFFYSSEAYKYKNGTTQVSIKPEDYRIPQKHVKMEDPDENRDDASFNLRMSYLHDEMDHRFYKYQEKNKSNEFDYFSKAHNFLGEAEKLYTSEMAGFIESSVNEEKLKETEKQVNQQVMKNFNINIQNPQAKSEFIEELNEELQKSLKKWFQDQLELFRNQLRREEEKDQVIVNQAFNTAKKYYSEEMEKETNSKDFIDAAELLKLDEKILEQALKTCYDLKLTFNQETKLQEALRGIFKKYQEKNLLRRPNINISPAIGIDLGTTNSCVAIYRNGKVEVIHNENGNKTTPSFVSFQDDGSVVVGDVAKEQSYRNPENTVFDAKRLIGRDFEDGKVQENIKMWSFKVVKEDENPKIQVVVNKPDDSDCPPADKKRKTSSRFTRNPTVCKTYHCEEISALVLRKMKKIAEDYLGVEVKDAVITVPALFNDYQRQATRVAGEIAGLNVLRIINEPTAASIAYNLHRTDELKKNVLVFDLGGGTLDVVVLQIARGEITVKSVHGDTHLGGQDFDSEMIKFCIDSFQQDHRINLARDQQSKSDNKRFDACSRLRRIRIECEKQKKVLSSNTKTIIGINYIESKPKLLDLHVPLTRDLFECLNQKHFDRCLEIVQLALAEAKMSKSEIDDVVLVGGSTRIPRIQKMLSDFFDGKTLCKFINPDQVVAEGAAIQACILSGQGVEAMNEIKLNDVSPFSIGIASKGEKFQVQIPKNTPLPCTFTQNWITVKDNQTGVEFKIYEGEDKMAVNNNLLGTYRVTEIPPNKPGVEKLPTTTTINEEGILHVQSKCLSSGASSELTVQMFNNRMTRKQIEDAKASVNFLME